MDVITTTLGELTCRIVGPENPDRLVVLCHGYGAPGTDLVGLAQALIARTPSLASTAFYFPAAPLSLGGAYFYESRAWWELDVMAIETAMARGEFREFRAEVPEGLPAARRKVHALLEEVLARTGLGLDRASLGGFSQGAMLMTDLALRLEEPPASLCVLSGTLLCEEDWRDRAAKRAGLPVFQSHGRQDPILPYRGAEWLREMLVESGIPVEFHPFDGPHAIPESVLNALAPFLAEH